MESAQPGLDSQTALKLEGLQPLGEDFLMLETARIGDVRFSLNSDEMKKNSAVFESGPLVETHRQQVSDIT